MRRITVRERPEFTERFPAEFNVAMTVRLRGGERLVWTTAFPKGHPRNPVSDLEIDEKYQRMLAGRPDRDREACLRLRDALWRLDQAADVNDVLAPLGGLTTSDASDGDRAAVPSRRGPS